MQGWRETDRWDGEPRYMYRNRNTGERASWSQVIGIWKNAYGRAIKARGEQPTKISPSGSETYRASAAQGYVSMIRSRLHEMARKQQVEGQGGLVLASAMRDLKDFFREDNASMYTRCTLCQKLSSNPYECEHCKQFIRERPTITRCEKCARNPSGYCRDHPRGSYGREVPFNQSAYNAGQAHARTADLGGSKVGGDSRGRLA